MKALSLVVQNFWSELKFATLTRIWSNDNLPLIFDTMGINVVFVLFLHEASVAVLTMCTVITICLKLKQVHFTTWSGVKCTYKTGLKLAATQKKTKTEWLQTGFTVVL